MDRTFIFRYYSVVHSDSIRKSLGVANPSSANMIPSLANSVTFAILFRLCNALARLFRCFLLRLFLLLTVKLPLDLPHCPFHFPTQFGHSGDLSNEIMAIRRKDDLLGRCTAVQHLTRRNVVEIRAIGGDLFVQIFNFWRGDGTV